MTRSYTYLGDKLTDPELKGKICTAIFHPDGKVVRGRNRNQLVKPGDLQMDLFNNTKCDHCGNNPGMGKNPMMWNGFIDLATGEHVCWDCQEDHYKLKSKIA